MTQATLEINRPTEVTPAYGRHETFHPRFGWLKKGFEHALLYPDIFRRADAPARLGVGKNMVKAIRYWCLAFKILVEVPSSENSRLRDVLPTPIGKRLLSDDGWDPFMERAASLWMLHWVLLRPCCFAPVWYATFNEFDALDFTDKELVSAQKQFLGVQDGWAEVNERTIEKDVSCLLRMYAGGNKAADVAEDTIDSPFVGLNLVRPTAGESRHYSFQVGPKTTLDPEVVAYAAIDFAQLRGISARTLSLAQLLHAPGSPGKVFRLTESALLDSLEAASQASEDVSLTRAGGVEQLVIGPPEERNPEKLLTQLYRRRGGRR